MSSATAIELNSIPPKWRAGNGARSCMPRHSYPYYLLLSPLVKRLKTFARSRPPQAHSRSLSQHFLDFPFLVASSGVVFRPRALAFRSSRTTNPLRAKGGGLTSHAPSLRNGDPELRNHDISLHVSSEHYVLLCLGGSLPHQHRLVMSS